MKDPNDKSNARGPARQGLRMALGLPDVIHEVRSHQNQIVVLNNCLSSLRQTMLNIIVLFKIV